MANHGTGCGTNTVQQPSCETYTHEPDCCPPKKVVGRPVCDMKFPVPACIPDVKNSCAPCDCVPCFTAEELALTPEAKEAVITMLEALLYAVSPVDRCDCKIIEPFGHDIPLKPIQKKDPTTGEFLWLQTNVDGSTEETTSAMNPDPAATVPNTPIFDDLCCGAGNGRHSAFLNTGVSGTRFKGGNAPGILGGISHIGSREYDEKMGELFCCAIDKIKEAAELVIK